MTIKVHLEDGYGSRNKSRVNRHGAIRVTPITSLETIPRKYVITLNLPGVATLDANLAGLRKQGDKLDVWITGISVRISHGANNGTGVPLTIFRAESVAGGTLIAAADVPKKNTEAEDAALEVRTGLVTGTKAAQRLMTLGGNTVNTALQTGAPDGWVAQDMSERIRLRRNEGLIFAQHPSLGDTDDLYIVTVEWEEGAQL